jgi:radical SAM protein with 4Fe4S-binding SPASM domain
MDNPILNYIPINKGHFSLEPQERIDHFQKLLSDGWEDEYKKYRSLWESLPMAKKVRNYPLLVDLELVSKCNLNCPMCPTITDEFHKRRKESSSTGYMDVGLAKHIIDEVHPYIYSLRLSWVGESTLHTNLIEIVRYAKMMGVKEVSFLTNGTKLHLDYMKKLIDAGLDIMTVSIDGMSEVYNKIRYPLKFDKTVQKLYNLKEYKKQNNFTKPLVKIQGVWPAIRPNPEEYYNLFEPITNLIAFNPLIDYHHNDQSIVYENNFSCSQPYQRLTVAADGRVAMCSNDDVVETVLGNANNESIHKIWHGEKIEIIRELHKKNNGFKENQACRNCYYPRKVESSEISVVNGREIVIENYVNRIQEIGK